MLILKSTVSAIPKRRFVIYRQFIVARSESAVAKHFEKHSLKITPINSEVTVIVKCYESKLYLLDIVRVYSTRTISSTVY